MTISYSRQVATSQVGTFARLLFRWRGSIYKLLYRELFIFMALYGIVSSVYRYALTDWQRNEFEQFALFCEETAGMIPMTFILGFYVSLIVGRWWNIFTNITYPDRLMLQVSCYLQGTDERARMSRRTIARYANLSQLLVLRDISSAVRKRFPTMQHLLDAGFMSEDDTKLYDNIDMVHHKFWVPLQWICSIVWANRKEGRIENDQNVVRIVNEILNLRTQINTLLSYDWISVPLVYTQVVTIAVYSYFLASIFGRQYLDPSKKYAHHEVDMYFPLFTLLQFVFYMGWLKVAESIMNPLGEDDDDFEVNYMIERNLQVAYAMADDNFMKIPPLKRDLHWNVPCAAVPHTFASAGLKDSPYVPSATNVQVTPEMAETAGTESMYQSTASLATTGLVHGRHRKLSSPSYSWHYSGQKRPEAKYSTRIRRVFSTAAGPVRRERRANGQAEGSRRALLLDCDESLLNGRGLFQPANIPASRSNSLQSTQPVNLLTICESLEKPNKEGQRRNQSATPRRKDNAKPQPMIESAGPLCWRLDM